MKKTLLVLLFVAAAALDPSGDARLLFVLVPFVPFVVPLRDARACHSDHNTRADGSANPAQIPARSHTSAARELQPRDR